MHPRLSIVVALATLTACASSRPFGADRNGPTINLPWLATVQDPATDTAASADDSAGAAPIGAGMMFSPTDVLFGGAIDFPIDDDLTFGPAVQVGVGDDFMIAPFAQAKYFVRLEDETGDPSRFLPFIQAGTGFAWVDRDGRDADSGLILNVGGGVRYRTGEAYRLGSQILFHFAPDDIAGDDFWVTWEIVQVILDF